MILEQFHSLVVFLTINLIFLGQFTRSSCCLISPFFVSWKVSLFRGFSDDRSDIFGPVHSRFLLLYFSFCVLKTFLEVILRVNAIFSGQILALAVLTAQIRAFLCHLGHWAESSKLLYELRRKCAWILFGKKSGNSPLPIQLYRWESMF